MGIDAHQELTEADRDRVASYLLGGLSLPESLAFEGHLEDCQPCREEVSRLRPTVEELLMSAPASDPPAGLRDQVLERTRGHPAAVLRAAERRWLTAGVPGVEIAQLWLDQTLERHTMLVRMEPGSSLPAHRHGGPEECYVVQGDLRDREWMLGAGDYVRYEAATQHSLTTDSGCLLLVLASLDDRRIDSE